MNMKSENKIPQKSNDGGNLECPSCGHQPDLADQFNGELTSSSVCPCCGNSTLKYRDEIKIETQNDKALTPEQICIGLLRLSDWTDSLNAHEGLGNVDEVISGAMEIVNEHAALEAVANTANSVLIAIEHGSDARLTLADMKDALANLAAIREGKAS